MTLVKSSPSINSGAGSDITHIEKLNSWGRKERIYKIIQKVKK